VKLLASATLLLIVLLLILIAIGVPITYSLGLASVVIMFFFLGGEPALSQVPLIIDKSLNEFTIVAVPLFILLAQILNHSNMAKVIYEVGIRLLGNVRGGLFIVTIIASGILAAITGLSVASLAMLAAVAYPIMRESGCEKKLTLGTLAVGGTLGILIPPSLPLIIYGAITEESVGKLFMAGILPGILSMIVFSLYVFWRGDKVTVKKDMLGKNVSSNIKGAFWGLLTIPLILGGLYSGLFTPTESAAVGVIYALTISIFVYRNINLQTLKTILLDTVNTSSMILFLVLSANLYGHVMNLLRVPQNVAAFVGNLDIPTWAVLAGFLVIFIIAGLFLDAFSVMLITLPVIYPILDTMEVNLIWFAILMIKTLEIGVITPPVGLNLYVLKGISKDIEFKEILQGVAPFYVLEVLIIIILILFPTISLYLPNMMGR
jgi:C4-dicarboxylate transporter DctM subunit